MANKSPLEMWLAFDSHYGPVLWHLERCSSIRTGQPRPTNGRKHFQFHPNFMVLHLPHCTTYCTDTYITSQANCNLLLLLYIILLIRGMVKNGKRRPWCGGWKTWPNQSPINQRSISSIAQALLDHAIHAIPFPSHPPYLSSEANKRECDT